MQRATGRTCMTTAVSKTLAEFGSIIGCCTAQTESSCIGITVAFKEGCNLYSLDVAQQAREVIVHIFACTCRSEHITGRLRPDQATATGGLCSRNNHSLKTCLCERACTINGLYDGFGDSPGS